jgi:hypothetical protein
MVTRDPQTLTKPADRSAALDLLDRARHNYDLHDVATPYALKVSFESNGVAETEGAWRMEEVSDGGTHWRWTAQLQAPTCAFSVSAPTGASMATIRPSPYLCAFN